LARNIRPEAREFLNQHCALVLGFESILRAGPLKIVLQQNRPEETSRREGQPSACHAVHLNVHRDSERRSNRRHWRPNAVSWRIIARSLTSVGLGLYVTVRSGSLRRGGQPVAIERIATAFPAPRGGRFSATRNRRSRSARRLTLWSSEEWKFAMQRECKLIESAWIKYRDEVLGSFSKAPPAAHLFVLRSTFFAGAYSLLGRIVAGDGDAEQRLRLIQAELERFNAEIGSSRQRRG